MLVASHLLDADTGSEQIYNALDCALTHEIFTKLSEQMPLAEPAYSFERAMQGPVLEMMLRGWRVDPGAREIGIQQTKIELDRLTHVINMLSQAVWDRDLNPNSSLQLKGLFYGRLGIPEIKAYVKGELKFPMDRDAIEQIEDYFPARLIAASVLEYRDHIKTLNVLETEVDADWRMRTSYNIGGTKAARFSSSKSPDGTGCVLPHAEALTPSGWKRVDQIQDGEMIMQWNSEANALAFVPCTMFSKDFSGKMLKVETEQTKQTLTPEHRVVYYDSRGQYRHVAAAKDVAKLSQCMLPIGGINRDGRLKFPRYLAMLMADFNYEPSGWRASFKKARKVERFLHIANEFKLEYTEQKENREGYRKFCVKGLEAFPKKWGSWVLDLTPECAKELIEEARYWDSHDRGSGFIFFTADEEQAQWFATLAHIAARSATIRREEQNEGSYSDTVMWWVNVKTRSHARIQGKHWKEVPYEGKVYCPSVPSTFWLMREDRFISVTGNTNLQNITESLRHIFIADPGYVLCGIDAEQSDSRMVGFMCGVLFNDWRYLDACESGDLHTAVARLTWPNLGWTGDLKKDKAIAEVPFYRHYTYRDCCKRLGHGTNFLGKATTLAKMIHIPLDLVIPFQEQYFSAFPAIQKWHAWTAGELQTKKQLTSIHGRTRDFFDRTDADETLRKALAFLAAAPTADNLNLGMYRIWKHMPEVQLLAQVHDAVYFQFPEELDPQVVIPKAQSYLSTPLRAPCGRIFTVPSDAQWGYNWGHAIPANEAKGTPEKNPRGLRKFKKAS